MEIMESKAWDTIKKYRQQEQRVRDFNLPEIICSDIHNGF